MNSNIRIARELIRMARALVAFDYDKLTFDIALEAYKRNNNALGPRNYLLMTRRCPEFVFRAQGNLKDSYAKYLMSINPSCPSDILETLCGDKDEKVSSNAQKTMDNDGWNPNFKDIEKHHEPKSKFPNTNYKNLYDTLVKYAADGGLKMSYNAQKCAARLFASSESGIMGGAVIMVDFIDRKVTAVDCNGVEVFSKEYDSYWDCEACVNVVNEAMTALNAGDKTDLIERMKTVVTELSSRDDDEYDVRVKFRKNLSNKAKLGFIYTVYGSDAWVDDEYGDNNKFIERTHRMVEEAIEEQVSVDFVKNTIYYQSVNDANSGNEIKFSSFDDCKAKLEGLFNDFERWLCYRLEAHGKSY